MDTNMKRNMERQMGTEMTCWAYASIDWVDVKPAIKVDYE
jgi:hypothetical protein